MFLQAKVFAWEVDFQKIGGEAIVDQARRQSVETRRVRRTGAGAGAAADAVLESLKVAAICRVLTPVVAKDTVLVSDGARAYASFAFETGIGHVGLTGNRGERRRGDTDRVAVFTSRG